MNLGFITVLPSSSAVRHAHSPRGGTLAQRPRFYSMKFHLDLTASFVAAAWCAAGVTGDLPVVIDTMGAQVNTKGP